MENAGRPVKTAVVGCGMISNSYIHNLKNLFQIVDLTAVCDVNPEAAREKAQTYGIPRTMTIDEVAADETVELVVCLTPVPAHYGILRRMLEAGKHVYTEKIFTADLEQSRELLALAESKGLSIGVAPDTVLGASIQTARHILDMGLVGKITSGFVSVARSQLLSSETYRFLQSEGGGLPYDVGIYYIGALIALLGPVKSIRAFAAPALPHSRELLFMEQKQERWQIPGSNLITAALEFASGALVSVHLNGNTVGQEQSRFELYGLGGLVKPGNPDRFGDPVRLQLPENEEIAFPFTHGYNGKNMLAPFPYEFYGHRGIGTAELCYSIRAGRQNRLSGQYGLHCQEVLFGMDRAAATGTTYEMTSTCQVRPLTPGFYSSINGGTGRGDAERSLMD